MIYFGLKREVCDGMILTEVETKINPRTEWLIMTGERKHCWTQLFQPDCLMNDTPEHKQYIQNIMQLDSRCVVVKFELTEVDTATNFVFTQIVLSKGLR